MPTYDYVCQACEHAFEQFQSITAKPLQKCPACGESTLRRLIGTGAGVLFKGSGFYETDYRSESYKKAAKAEKESASGSSSESQGKSKNGDGAASASQNTGGNGKADTASGSGKPDTGKAAT